MLNRACCAAFSMVLFSLATFPALADDLAPHPVASISADKALQMLAGCNTYSRDAALGTNGFDLREQKTRDREAHEYSDCNAVIQAYPDWSNAHLTLALVMLNTGRAAMAGAYQTKMHLDGENALRKALQVATDTGDIIGQYSVCNMGLHFASTPEDLKCSPALTKSVEAKFNLYKQQLIANQRAMEARAQDFASWSLQMEENQMPQEEFSRGNGQR
jgi:hypothetical protein